jgi:hypothetical protein
VSRAAEIPGRITFYEFFEPPLESGRYHVGVEHEVVSRDPANPFEQTFSTGLDFAVQGVRFSLPPGYVHTQFPAPGAQGDYANVLPHVVLSVETLPWQRDPGGAQRESDDPYPWLALLAFDGDDPPPPVQAGTVHDLLPAGLPPGTVSYPDLTLEPGESASDPCEFVDVPIDLFAAIAPGLEDLRWLAHGRHLDPEALARKALGPADTPPQDLSTVVANRVPAAGGKTVCCLVSLESMAHLLPPSQLPPDATAVRLVVLAFWSFGSVARVQSFRERFVELDREPGTLEVPYAAGPGATNQAVQDALRMGYAAFGHHTRQGARTVSWYRGPLLPYENPPDAEIPFSSADALVRYDPESGMIDVTLAAAWQLGRLLALSDRGFASLLYEWKQGQRAHAVVAFEREFLAERLGADPAMLWEPGGRTHVALMQNVVKPLLAAFVDGAEAPASAGDGGS